MINLQIASPALPDSISSLQSDASMIRTLSTDELIEKLVNYVVSFSINLAIAIAVFYSSNFAITTPDFVSSVSSLNNLC